MNKGAVPASKAERQRVQSGCGERIKNAQLIDEEQASEVIKCLGVIGGIFRSKNSADARKEEEDEEEEIEGEGERERRNLGMISNPRRCRRDAAHAGLSQGYEDEQGKRSRRLRERCGSGPVERAENKSAPSSVSMN